MVWNFSQLAFYVDEGRQPLVNLMTTKGLTKAAEGYPATKWRLSGNKFGQMTCLTKNK